MELSDKVRGAHSLMTRKQKMKLSDACNLILGVWLSVKTILVPVAEFQCSVSVKGEGTWCDLQHAVSSAPVFFTHDP